MPRRKRADTKKNIRQTGNVQEKAIAILSELTGGSSGTSSKSRKRSDTNKNLIDNISFSEGMTALAGLVGGDQSLLDPGVSSQSGSRADTQKQQPMAGFSLNEFDPDSLNPIDRIGYDSAIKGVKEQAEEAKKQIGPEALLASIIQKNSQSFGQAAGAGVGQQAFDPTQSFAQAPQVAPQQPASQPQQQSGGVNPIQALQGLLKGVGGLVQGAVDIIPTSPAAKLANAQTAILNQELGQEKLSKREELSLQHQFDKDLVELKAGLESGGLDALTPESATKFSMLNNGQSVLSEAATLLEKNPNLLSTGNLPGAFRSQEARQFRTLLGEAFEARLRAVSGAALSENDIQTQKKNFMVRLTDSPETMRVKFTTLNNFFEGALNTADPTGGHRQRASGIQSKGSPFTPDQVEAEIARRGL